MPLLSTVDAPVFYRKVYTNVTCCDDMMSYVHINVLRVAKLFQKISIGTDYDFARTGDKSSYEQILNLWINDYIFQPPWIIGLTVDGKHSVMTSYMKHVSPNLLRLYNTLPIGANHIIMTQTEFSKETKISEFKNWVMFCCVAMIFYKTLCYYWANYKETQLGINFVQVKLFNKNWSSTPITIWYSYKFTIKLTIGISKVMCKSVCCAVCVSCNCVFFWHCIMILRLKKVEALNYTAVLNSPTYWKPAYLFVEEGTLNSIVLFIQPTTSRQYVYALFYI